MKHVTIRIAVLALLIAVAGTAADAKTMGTASSDVLEKANNLIGMSVEDSSGENIGTVVDLVLDRNLNTVSHVVFGHRTARQGWEHFAVPFDEVTISSTRDAVLLDVAGLRDFEDVAVSRGWFQGPMDIEAAPVEKRTYARDYDYQAEKPVVDIYGRPIPGRAQTPYVQNVYKTPVDSKVPMKDSAYYDESQWRAYERDQYGRPVYERNYYVGDDTFGHNGATVQKHLGSLENRYDVYGRPIDRAFEPSRSDWRWGESSLESDYDVYGRPITRDRSEKPLDYGTSLDYDRYGRPIYRDYDRYGRPLESDRVDKSLDYDRYGRPLKSDRFDKSLDYDRYGRPSDKDYDRPIYRDTWRDREFDRSYRKTGRDMGAWFKTDWSRDANQLGLRRVSNLIGTDVAVRGRDAGNIEDVVIDTREGHIAYMLISLTDTFAGSPNRMAAVPRQAVDLMPDQHLAELDVSRQQLLRLAFTANNMPDLSDMAYARRLHEQFDISPYWEVFGYVEPSGVSKFSGTAWNPDSWYAKAFDPDNIVTFSGTIESVSSFKPAPDATAGIRLRIRTDDGRLMLVNAGPSGFATQKGISFQEGDHITVTGSRAQIAGQNVFLASQLRMGDQTVQLRTRQGRPLW